MTDQYLKAITGEDESLPTHVSACLMRYAALQKQLNRISYVLLGLLAVNIITADGPLVLSLTRFFLSP